MASATAYTPRVSFCATDGAFTCCVQTVRQKLYDELVKLNSDKDWSFITDQIGMFSFTGLSPAQVCPLGPVLQGSLVLCSGKTGYSAAQPFSADSKLNGVTSAVQKASHRVTQWLDALDTLFSACVWPAFVTRCKHAGGLCRTPLADRAGVSR